MADLLVSSEITDQYTLKDNTFSKAIKSDPKDAIEIEIGDSKQLDFKPQFKVMRWDNEVNFSMRAVEHPQATVETVGEVVKYITPDYEVHQYEKPEAGEDGGFEFEWVLPSQPLTNILTATIQTKELDFLYQPELTEEEVVDGHVRPDNVVGSYAVYHKTKGGMNDAAGKEYKTGKAFHIYRPEAVDSKGSRTWCDLSVDTDLNVLTVTVPNGFLEKAVYPVVVDPTFGITAQGGSDWSLASRFDSTFVASRGAAITGTLTEVAGYFKKSNTSANTITLSLYSNSGSTPSTSLASTSGITLTTSYALKTASLSYSMTGSDYWAVALGISTGDSGSSSSVAYDATGGDSAYKSISWFASTIKFSVYATYTAGGSSVVKKLSSVAQASIKKLSSMTLATVKKVSGVANS